MDHHYSYDLFISHAVEDKILLVNELAARLEARGIKVWYTGQELSIGDAVRDTLVEGIRHCRYGVIVFSPSYISKIMSSGELSMLINYKRQGEKVIIPILFEVTTEELASRNILTGISSAIYSNAGLEDVVTRLLQQIDMSHRLPAPESGFIGRHPKGKLYAALALALGLILLLYGFSILLT